VPHFSLALFAELSTTFLRCNRIKTKQHKHPFNCPFPGLPRWANTRKVKPIWILLKQESEWQWHQLGHMQVCTSLQTDNHASTPPLSFYRPDALPAAQPTASKHWRQRTKYSCNRIKYKQIITDWQIPGKWSDAPDLCNKHYKQYISNSGATCLEF